MTTNAVYHLSNLAIEQEFDLTVAQGADVMAAAQAHLEESGLYGDRQRGFYISVYPRTPADSASVNGDAVDPAALKGTPSEDVAVGSTGVATGVRTAGVRTAGTDGTVEEEAILA